MQIYVYLCTEEDSATVGTRLSEALESQQCDTFQHRYFDEDSSSKFENYDNEL